VVSSSGCGCRAASCSWAGNAARALALPLLIAVRSLCPALDANPLSAAASSLCRPSHTSYLDLFFDSLPLHLPLSYSFSNFLSLHALLSLFLLPFFFSISFPSLLFLFILFLLLLLLLLSSLSQREASKSVREPVGGPRDPAAAGARAPAAPDAHFANSTSLCPRTRGEVSGRGVASVPPLNRSTPLRPSFSAPPVLDVCSFSTALFQLCSLSLFHSLSPQLCLFLCLSYFVFF